MLDVEDIRLHAFSLEFNSEESHDAYEKAVQTLVMEKIAFSDALAASGNLTYDLLNWEY